MKLLIILFASVVFTSCHTTKDGKTIHSDNTNSNVLPSKIPDDFYLENRVANCDSAILYMKSVVTPGNLEVSILPELSARAYIRGESKQFFTRTSNTNYPSDNYPFYISLSCLKGQKAQVVYDIFIKPEYHKALQVAEKTASEDGYYLAIKGLGGFGFRIVNGKVAFASADVYIEKQ